MKTKISIVLLTIVGLVATVSCTSESDSIDSIGELNHFQKQFYSIHEQFLDQFGDNEIMNWIKQIEFDEETGEMIDSKVLLLEDYLTEEQMDAFFIELYANDKTSYFIIHDEDNAKGERILENPKFKRISLADKTHQPEEKSETAHIWKHKKNNALGGCDFKWSSVCVIRADVVVFH